MIQQEYYSVNELSQLNNMTSRNIRKIIASMKDKKSDSLLYKDSNNSWRVHHLLIPEFKRKRTKTISYKAITIDPVEIYSYNEIIERLNQVSIMVDDNSLDFRVTVEVKKGNVRNHIHGYYCTKRNRAFINALKFWFPSMSYHITEAYDLEGWKDYITKDDNKIITINKNKK